ncbi:MAG: RadC family protein [Fluviibacter sp.]|jgi:DNA repair protein RadC
MSLTDRPSSERPREKLLQRGPEFLSDSELIAILLRTGLPGQDAIALAQALIERFGGLYGLLSAPSKDLTDTLGLGPAKTAQLIAVLELARRTLREEMAAGVSLASVDSVRRYLKLSLAHREYEVFHALWLDARNRLIASEELFRGSLTQTSVYPREIVRRALQHNAAAVIFAHNHPSGIADPSGADEHLTSALQQALGLIDVRLLDHFIIAGMTDPYSFSEHGKLA